LTIVNIEGTFSLIAAFSSDSISHLPHNQTDQAVHAITPQQGESVVVDGGEPGSGKPTLNARIGIETDPVCGGCLGRDYGDAPTAARLQALAESGSVIVTAQVQRQVAVLFVAEEPGSHELKGVPEPRSAAPCCHGASVPLSRFSQRTH
jgi:class 3 adenylate cyclase